MKVREKEDRDVLQFTCNLAILLQATGKYAKARDIMQAVLEIQQPLLIEDLNIFRKFHLLGTNFFEKGMHQISEQLILLALDGQQKVLCDFDVTTLLSVATLVEVHLDQDDTLKAEALARAALQKWGESSIRRPASFKLKNGLADALQLQKKYEESATIHTKCLDGYEKLYGMSHPDTLTSMSNLGHVYDTLGRYAEAEDMHRRAVAGFEKVSGFDEAYTWRSKSNLATFLTK